MCVDKRRLSRVVLESQEIRSVHDRVVMDFTVEGKLRKGEQWRFVDISSFLLEGRWSNSRVDPEDIVVCLTSLFVHIIVHVKYICTLYGSLTH